MVDVVPNALKSNFFNFNITDSFKMSYIVSNKNHIIINRKYINE